MSSKPAELYQGQALLDAFVSTYLLYSMLDVRHKFNQWFQILASLTFYGQMQNGSFVSLNFQSEKPYILPDHKRQQATYRL